MLPKIQSDTTLYISMPESYTVPVGGKMVLKGGGFDATSNTITVGATTFTAIKRSTNGNLEVVIPATMQKGKHAVTVSNSKGISNKSFVVVTDVGVLPPRIIRITPTTGPLGTKILVVGENFSKEWNEISVGAETISIPSQDGISIAFTPALPIPGYVSGQDVPGPDISLPIWITITNPNGMSNPVVFTATI
jgi:hypothetical protein